jgi:hypothetical protein
MKVPETVGGRLAAAIVALPVLFGAAWGSKWLIVTKSWGIWAVLFLLFIIAAGVVASNWVGKSQ